MARLCQLRVLAAAAGALGGLRQLRLRAAAADEALPGGVCCGSPPQWSSPEPWLGVAVVSLERAVETRCALADVLGLAHWKVLQISWQWLSWG